MAFGRKGPAILSLALAAYVLLSSLYGLDSYPLIDPDEPRYAQAAHEMVLGGDYVVPHLCGTPRITKPPLLYWAIAAAGKAGVGSWEAAARLPSAAAGLLTVGVVFLLAREFYGSAAGAFSLPVLFSMPLFAALTHLAITDALLTAFLSAALYSWWRVYVSGGHLVWSVVSWVMLALAFLSKGPVGPLLYVLIVAAFCAMAGEWSVLRRSFRWPGVLAFLAIAVPWPVAVSLSVPGAAETWWRETALRFATGVDHGGNVFFPFAVFAGGALPWWLLPGGGLARLRELPARLTGDPRLRLLFAWVGMVLLFFAFSRSQLATYVLPAVPPVAVGACGVLAGYYRGANRAVAPLVRAFAGAVVLVGSVSAYGLAKGEISTTGMALTAAALVGAVGIFAALLVRGRLRAAAVLLVVAVAAVAFFSTLPALRRIAARRSFEPLVSACRSQLRSADDLLLCGRIGGSLTFYSGCYNARRVTAAEAAEALSGSRRTAAVLQADRPGEFEKIFALDLYTAGTQTQGRSEYVILTNFDPAEVDRHRQLE